VLLGLELTGKVTEGDLSFGFAAGVGFAAVAPPRRNSPVIFLGFALGAAFGSS
jgi:hypothetical protein